MTEDLIKKSMLENARDVVSAYTLCDACLGRLFGKLGHGLTNAERGAALKTALSQGVDAESKMDDGELLTALVMRLKNTRAPPGQNSEKNNENENAENDKEKERCWLCNGLMNEIDKFADLALKAMSEYEYSTFLIGTKIDDEIKSKEERLWNVVDARFVEPMNSELNREIGKAVLQKLDGADTNLAKPDVAAIIDTRYDVVMLEVAPLFIYGRYRKLERGIPQTKWLCRACQGKGCERCRGLGKMYPTSVQELIAEKVMAATRGDDNFFHGMGREDIDVRMLGNGRPFVLEIRRPRIRTLDFAELERAITTFAAPRVEVEGLRLSDRNEVIEIKEKRSNKHYRAVFLTEERLDEPKIREAVYSLRGKTIEQQTPTRVVHRRADLQRARTVHDIAIEKIEEKRITVVIEGESGLYIKEIIHGDEGRTKPSIAALLGTPCVVESLDVIQLDY